MYSKEKGAFCSQSFDVSVTMPKGLDMHKMQASRQAKSISVRGEALGVRESLTLDVNTWLPAAAEHYNISPDIRDYVLHPTVVNVSGLPNTNGDAFGLKDWLTFRPEFGMLAYKTFKGKPTFIEHNNQNHRVARGAIFDSQMSKLRGFHQSHGRVILLLAYDRSLEPELCRDILTGKHNTYSKGTWYKAYTCSVCGETYTGASTRFCEHVGGRVRRMPDGRLAYKQCHLLEGFETSAVRNPAFVCASPDPSAVMDPQNKERW